ncbi:hypothetical protein AC1031_007424 [Aphanomyces cochlioides]|nr:hypothetical protein AC1031_007424 [Aphanomyces cochlioides]
MVFVNSEEYPWLPQFTTESKTPNLNPDGFATHPGMYRVKPTPEDSVLRPNEREIRFGVPEEELFDCLIFFESKLDITDAAFGRVVRYLQNLFPRTSASAILFDRCSFWMIKCRKDVIVKVVKAKWVDCGSKTLFQNFLTDNTSPWVTLLTNACLSLRVNVVEGGAYLGRSAYGRVFKVIGEHGEVFALKVVKERCAGSLFREKEALMNATNTGLTIRPVGKCVEIPGGAALLLSPVGKSLPRPTTRREVKQLFDLMWQLHEKGHVHGDPRVPNVIINGDEPLWIDLAETSKANLTLREMDAEILTRSILHDPLNYELSAVLKEMSFEYGQNSTRENLDRLATEVCESLNLPSEA